MYLTHYIQSKGSFITFNFLIVNLFFRVDAERALQEILERIVVVLSVAGFLQQLQASSVYGHVECQTFGSFK
jgi:hypothetical protein